MPPRDLLVVVWCFGWVCGVTVAWLTRSLIDFLQEVFRDE